MIIELDLMDFYCTALHPLVGDDQQNQHCKISTGKDADLAYPDCCIGCDCMSYRWPTHKQFKKEYGTHWDGACYYFIEQKRCENPRSWWASECPINPDYDWDCLFEVCACTPYGTPPDDWRPKK